MEVVPVKRFVTLLALAGLSVGLALPIVAQDKLGKDDKSEKICKKDMGCESVSIDKPFTEIVGRIPEVLKSAGLILAADIDWAKLGTGSGTLPRGSGSMPGETPRLEGTSANVHTFLIVDDFLVTEVRKEPAHAMWLGKMVAFDKAGKTEIIYVKPSAMIEHMKKSGMLEGDKAEEHMKQSKDYERKLEQAVDNLKTGGFGGERR
jgi:hypothetical protein